MKTSNLTRLLRPLLLAVLLSPGLIRAEVGDYVAYLTLPTTPATDRLPLQAAWYANQTPRPQGGVLIVGAELVTDRTHDNLAYQLSRHGWSTLIIQLPDPPAAGDNTTVDNNTVNNNTVDNKRAPAPLTDAEYLRLAVNHLQSERNLYNLVLLNSDSGWQRLQSAGTPAQALANFQGYVLFKVNSPGSLAPLSEDSPVLDLVDRFSAGDFHQQRLLEAQRSQRLNYQTVELTEIGWEMAPRVERFSRRIRGWLKVNLQGMQLKGS